MSEIQKARVNSPEDEPKPPNLGDTSIRAFKKSREKVCDTKLFAERLASLREYIDSALSKKGLGEFLTFSNKFSIAVEEFAQNEDICDDEKFKALKADVSSYLERFKLIAMWASTSLDDGSILRLEQSYQDKCPFPSSLIVFPVLREPVSADYNSKPAHIQFREFFSDSKDFSSMKQIDTRELVKRAFHQSLVKILQPIVSTEPKGMLDRIGRVVVQPDHYSFEMHYRGTGELADKLADTVMRNRTKMTTKDYLKIVSYTADLALQIAKGSDGWHGEADINRLEASVAQYVTNLFSSRVVDSE